MKNFHLTMLCGLLLFSQSVHAQTCNPNIIADAPDSRYTLNSNGTALDKKTGLTWMRCTLGQSWSNNACTGSTSYYNWQGALQIADTTSYAGYDDWRLPNQKELQSLVENRCYDPAINSVAFPNTPTNAWFWSSSPGAKYSSSAWIVYFKYGYGSYDNEGSYYFVRLVRGGQ